MTGRDAIEFNNGRFDVFRGAIDMAHGRGGGFRNPRGKGQCQTERDDLI